MRINRPSYRRSRPLRGCLPFVVSLALLLALAWGGRGLWRDWAWQLIQPNPADVTLTDARQAYARGNLDQTIRYGQQLRANNPDDVGALILLARAHIYRSYVDYNHARDRQTALELTTRAYERDPLNLDVQAIHAFAQQDNGDYESAVRNALRVLRNDRNHPIARVTLALAYGNQGLFSAALREAEVAVTIADTRANDWRADAYRALAIAHSDLAQYDAAATAIEQAITHQRRLIPLHFERALYALQVGDTDTATATYFNIIAFDAENVKARLRLCEVSSQLSERAAAIDYCTDVVDRAPGWVDGWYTLGREYYLSGDWLPAQQAMARCTALQVAQDVPIPERRLECWYIQGQAAEVLRDCPTLLTLYAEFQQMVQSANLTQTWVYPPGGPPVCADFMATGTPARAR